MGRRKKRRTLTEKQQKYMKALCKGMGQSQAWRAAGYASVGAGYHSTKLLRERIQKAFFEAGLTPEGYIHKHLLPALDAKQTEFAKFEGKITDREDTINWTARLKAMEIVKDMAGYSAPREHELAGKDGAPLSMPKVIDVSGMRSKPASASA
jgi:phage terminase small subunit